jgi:hypothetical protein
MTGMEEELEVREIWDSIVATTGVLDTVNYEDYIETDDNLLNASKLTDQEITENVQTCLSNVDITFENVDDEEHGDEPIDEKISLSEVWTA